MIFGERKNLVKEIERQPRNNETLKMFAIIIPVLAIYIGYQFLKRRFNTGKYIFFNQFKLSHLILDLSCEFQLYQQGNWLIYLLSWYFFILFEENVRGKNVVITGASTGLGEQLAYHYARLGANIVISSNEQRLEQVHLSCTFTTFYF